MPDEPKHEGEPIILRRVQEGETIRKGGLNPNAPTLRPSGQPAPFGPPPQAQPVQSQSPGAGDKKSGEAK